ncbi:MAG: A/G-specific adenine glycosylase [Patescibacteria group bacterium]|jgi:A/G-specific adenine glycosylase
MQTAKAKIVRKKLLSWFSKHQRDLPWRKIKNPYHILVSEIMLQQTQVDRVIPKYQAFLKRFPSLSALAKVRQASVIAMWAGLGYNRRARNLHQLAKKVVKEHKGKLPAQPAILQSLPGIGPYTAAAVACFAYGAPVALVDVNVRRVLGRVFHGVHGPEKLAEAALWKLAGSMVPPKQAVAWNSSLMDFGATVCTKRSPTCATCPLQKQCAAYPAILTQTIVQEKKEAFHDSNRFWRGKMIQYLRQQPRRSALIAALHHVMVTAGLEPVRSEKLLHGLAKDGLVRLRGTKARL